VTDRPHVLIVEARFYEDIADELVGGAVTALTAAGATYDRIEVPGAFEIPAAIGFAAERRDGPRYDAYLGLGCVIRGETSHYDYVCGESARGMMDLSIDKGLALGYGVLTVENREQALVRASAGENGKNKGRDVAEAALRMHELKTQFGAAS
jgi:6,7-dimethyl-8-ribityllumazine synthase